jgi:hypothetical protein
MQHARKTGLLSEDSQHRFKVKGVSLTDGKVLVFNSQLAAEKFFTGKGSSAIHHCFIGKKKSAYGYKWERV